MQKPIPVVVITWHDQPESRGRAMRLGAKAYLCKPIDEEALLSAMEYCHWWRVGAVKGCGMVP